MESYIAKVVHCGEGAAVTFGGNLSFSDFANKIRIRFPQFEKLNFKLKYKVHPDPIVYQLENEVDMKVMFIVLDRCKSDFVEVEIQSCGDSRPPDVEAVVSNNVVDDDSGSMEENEFLGRYRPEDSEMYKSDVWKSFIKSNGQSFEGGVKEFRIKLRMYAIATGFEYEFETNKADRVIAVCKKKKSENCNWFVKASICRFNGFFVIYELVNEHQCSCVIRLQKSSMISSQIIKEVMLDKARDNPNLTAIDVQKDMKLNYGLDIPYHSAWYGKKRAMESVLGVESDSYHHISWFGEQTCKANPSSKVVIECTDESNRFQRMFVCYDAWVNGFQHCRPVLHIDATFITNKYKGMLLFASTKDANWGLYPVAYAIVDSESESNWTFFFKLLSECLSRFSERQITFIFDRNIGLLKAVRSVFPRSPVGFYYKHLQSDLSKKFPSSSYLSKRIPELFMLCAYSLTREYFNLNFQKLKLEGGDVVNEFLKDLPLETWASCFFNGERFGEMTNNLAECFINWVVNLKCLPIVELNEAIRVKSMALIDSRKEESAGWATELCPYLEKKLVADLESGRHWFSYRSDTYVYEVKCQTHSVTVDLEQSLCSCGEWKVDGFPCSHALVVIQNHGLDVYSYVDPIFKVCKYRDTYSFSINPVPTISTAVDICESSFVVEPPLTKRGVGRPKLQEYKSENEVEKEVKRVVMCSRCKKYSGHNRKTCKEVI